MAMAVGTAQPLRYLQDVTALVMSQWERVDLESKRMLVERLRNQSTAALLVLEAELFGAEQVVRRLVEAPKEGPHG
jgi:hypothetical protein